MYFIYFIKVAENIKIGICKATLKHLKQRLSEANRWSPNSEILGLLLVHDTDTEKKLHIYFKDCHINNEIFAYDKAIIKFIKAHCNWAKEKRYLSVNFNNIEYDKNLLTNELRLSHFVTGRIKFFYENLNNDILSELRKAVKTNVKKIFFTWQQWAKRQELLIKVEEEIESHLFCHENDHDEYGSCTDVSYCLLLGDKEINVNDDENSEWDYDDLWTIAEEYYHEKQFKKHPDLDIDFYDDKPFDDRVLKVSLPRKKEDSDWLEFDFENQEDDDFTGIGDDGFHYVDGYFNICDPLGIEFY